MRRRFSHAFEPPAPVVPVRLGAPGGPQSAALDGKIDTGTDLCSIPERLVVELDLPPIRSVRAIGVTGSARDVVVYRVDVEVDGLVFPRVETLAVDRTYALLGRNLLRMLIVRLDGPREWLDLRRARIKT